MSAMRQRHDLVDVALHDGTVDLADARRTSNLNPD